MVMELFPISNWPSFVYLPLSELNLLSSSWLLMICNSHLILPVDLHNSNTSSNMHLLLNSRATCVFYSLGRHAKGKDITISQRQYASRFLQHFELENCHKVYISSLAKIYKLAMVMRTHFHQNVSSLLFHVWRHVLSFCLHLSWYHFSYLNSITVPTLSMLSSFISLPCLLHSAPRTLDYRVHFSSSTNLNGFHLPRFMTLTGVKIVERDAQLQDLLSASTTH